MNSLGNTNRAVLVNDDTEILVQEVSAAEARKAINQVNYEQTTTDLAAGLQEAQNYQGQLVLASDADHTVDSQNVESLINSMEANRNVKIMESSADNSWGIVDLNVKSQWIEVKNYEEERSQITISIDDSSEQITLEPGEARRASIDLEEGKNTISLPEDGMAADNKIFVSIPESKRVKTALIADNRNRYLLKAFELINSTYSDYYRTPIDEFPEADLYVFGQSERLLS